VSEEMESYARMAAAAPPSPNVRPTSTPPRAIAKADDDRGQPAKTAVMTVFRHPEKLSSRRLAKGTAHVVAVGAPMRDPARGPREARAASTLGFAGLTQPGPGPTAQNDVLKSFEMHRPPARRDWRAASAAERSPTLAKRISGLISGWLRKSVVRLQG
jgi:hypothetical protein